MDMLKIDKQILIEDKQKVMKKLAARVTEAKELKKKFKLMTEENKKLRNQEVNEEERELLNDEIAAMLRQMDKLKD